MNTHTLLASMRVDALGVNGASVDCLDRLVSEMTCYVPNETLNSTHSLIHSFTNSLLFLFHSAIHSV